MPGQRLEGFRLRAVSRRSKLVNLFATGFQAVDRGKMAEHGKCAANLLERTVDRRTIKPLGRIAEKHVERLLDLGQIALDFLADLTDQQTLLRPSGHFIERRQLLVARHRFTGDAGIQARNHQIDLLGEVGSQTLEALLGILQQQDRRGDFHGDGIAVPSRRFRQPVGNRPEALAKPLQVGIADFFGQRGADARMVDKACQAAGIASAKAVPQLFGRRQGLAQFAQCGVLRFLAGGRSRCRNKCRQREDRLDRSNLRTEFGRCPGNVIQRFAHDALSNIVRAFEQAADLGIEMRAQLARRSVAGHFRRDKRVQEGLPNPPE